jgi:hypothetical protein
VRDTGTSLHHVPSPFTRDQLSPAMQQRYGMDRRPVGRWIAVGLLAVAFVAALAFVTVGVSASGPQSRLLSWDDVAADRVDITFEVDRQDGAEVTCVLRAQDRNRIDVGYAIVTIPAGEARLRVEYALRTLAPAYTAELLGCAVGGLPTTPPPQFPPGVVPPEQPFEAPG